MKSIYKKIEFPSAPGGKMKLINNLIDIFSVIFLLIILYDIKKFIFFETITGDGAIISFWPFFGCIVIASFFMIIKIPKYIRTL